MRKFGICHIMDIGPHGVAPNAIHRLPIEEHGIQPASSISTVLLNARTGLLHYPVDYLTKSGIWSSYIAHGVIPLVVSPTRPTEMVDEGQHFLRLTDGYRISEDVADSVHQEGYDWYRTHAHSTQAARHFVDLMQRAKLAS
jgi:hypothetical protein